VQAVVILLALGSIGLGGGLITISVLADHSLREAKRALERQAYSEAWKHLNRANAFRPRSLEIHLLLARVARQLGKFDEADEHLCRCQKLRGGHHTEEEQLERLMLRAQTGEVEQVFSLLWPYVEDKKPEASLVLEALCYGSVGEGLTSLAESCMRRWRRIDPNNIQALVCEGWFWEQAAGPTLEAEENYIRALELDPERDDIRFRLALTYLRLQNQKKAIRCFKELLQRDPHNDAARVGLATAYREVGQGEESRAILNDFLQEHPNSIPALRQMAHLAVEEGKFAKAEEFLRKALKQEPNDYQTLHLLFSCVSRSGNKAEIRELSRHLERVRWVERQLNDLIRVKLRAQPKDPDLRYQVGVLYEELGSETQASEWYVRALQTDPHHQGALKGLVRYHEKKGDNDKAEEFRAGLFKR